MSLLVMLGPFYLMAAIVSIVINGGCFYADMRARWPEVKLGTEIIKLIGHIILSTGLALFLMGLCSIMPWSMAFGSGEEEVIGWLMLVLMLSGILFAVIGVVFAVWALERD